MAIINKDNLKAILSDFKTKMEAKITEAGKVPTKVSELTNDSEFQTKTEVTSAINTAVGKIVQMNIKPVEQLPEDDIDDHTIYLVPSENGSENNAKIEYLHVDGAWEIIGSTTVDLSNYSTTEQVQQLINTATAAMTPEEVTTFNKELWGEE